MNQSSKKLAVFLPSLHSGGAERTMLKLACGIASRGYPIDLVLARAEGSFLEQVPESIRIIDLHASRDILSLAPLISYLRKERPAALLSGLHTNLVALWARWVARVQTRVIISERNNFSQFVNSPSANIRVRLLPQLSRWFYPWADSIVGVSQGVAADLQNLLKGSGTPIRAIYNPVVTPELRSQAQADIDHPWFHDNELPVVIAVGRLTAQKDYPLLIAAFARVLKTHKARLCILGEGEERVKLDNLIRELGIEEYVAMPGFVLNPLPYLAHSTVFVLSSKFEGLPGVLIEAMFCGIPLIATDCPSGPREILEDGKYGRLVPVGDVDALSVAIFDALENKIEPPPADSWQRFTLDSVLDQYIEEFFGAESR